MRPGRVCTPDNKRGWLSVLPGDEVAGWFITGPTRVIRLAIHELLLRNTPHAQTGMCALHCLVRTVCIQVPRQEHVVPLNSST